MSDPVPATAPPGYVAVVTPDGKVGYLPAAVAPEAAAAGVRPASDDQIRGAQVQANAQATKAALDAKFSGSIGNEVEGAVGPVVAGAARGLTLGGSDEALAQIPGVRRKLLDYQNYAPVASAAGELGAIAGAAFLGDEAGLGAIPNAVGRLGVGAEAAVARGLGGGMLARGAGVLARGAAEGGVYGASSVVSESAIHDTPITAEAMVGGVAHGALGGMVASGLLHGAGAAVGGVRGAFRPKASAFEAIASREFGEAAPGVGKALAGDAEKAAAHPSDVKFDPATQGGAYRAPGTPFDTAGEAYIKTQPSAKQSDLGEVWKNRQIAFNDGAERIEGHSRDLQKAITEQQAAARVTDMNTFGDAKVNHMDKLVDRGQFEQQADKVMQWMFKAQQDINVLASDTAASKLGPAARKEFESHMSRIGKALESGDSLELFKAADNAKRFLGKEAQFGRRAVGLSEAAKAFDSLYQGEGGLMKVLEDGAWGKAGQAQRTVNAATSEHIGKANVFGRKFAEEYGSTAGRPDFRASSEGVTNFLGRLTKAAADNDAQTFRDMVSTRRAYLDATASSYDHGTAATKAIAAERDALSRMEATFEKATKETALINQVKRLQSEEQAQKIGGLLGLATDTLSKPVSTLQRLAQIEQHTQSVLDKIGMGSKKLAGAAESVAEKVTPAALAAPKGAGKGFFSLLLERAGTAGERTAIAGATTGRRAYDRRVEAMSELQANSAALTARVGNALGPIANDAPKVTAAATGIALSGLSFLASKMPPSGRDPFTLQPQFQPTSRASDSQIAQHMRYVEALDNPTMVLDLAKQGKLTPDHVEAVKAVYPKLYDQMRQDIFQGLVTSKSELPYGRRIQLGILLDLPTDQTLAPDFVSAIQATYTASEKAGVEPPPPQLSTLDVSTSLQTATQAAGGMDR